VTVSGEFLGLPVRTGNVLYLQLEEPLTTIKKRFRLAGFGNLENDEEASLVVNFGENRLRVERSFDLTTELDWLIKQIKKYEPALVIIDSLRKATAKSGHSENTNEFGKLVYGLQQVFSLTNTCGLVIHHLSKYGQDKNKKFNLVERLAGHTSISSASDGLIGLFDESSNSDQQSGSKTVTLKTRPRDGFGVGVQYSWETSKEGIWDFKRLDLSGPSKLIATSKILRYLASNCDTYVDNRTIADALNTSISNKDFLDGIQYLVELEILKTKMQDKKRFYCLPSESNWIVNPTSIKSLVSEAVIDANNLMRCNSKESIRNLTTSWDKNKKRDALSVLLENERIRINQLITGWEFSVNDTVNLLPDVSTVYEIIERVGESNSLNDNQYSIKDINGDEMFIVDECQLLLHIEEKETLLEDINPEEEPEVSNIGV
jgi:archaellum biogenesis ATPase FlaH